MTEEMIIYTAIFVICAVLITWASLWAYIPKRKARENGVYTTARVVDTERVKSGLGCVRCPVFEYDNGTETVRMTYTSSFLQEQFAVGEEVNIYYNPEKPQVIYLENVKKDMSLIILLCVFGVVVVIALCNIWLRNGI